MNWQSIDKYNTLKPRQKVVITDGTDWVQAFATGKGGFVEKIGDMMEWGKGITHFLIIGLPKK